MALTPREKEDMAVGAARRIAKIRPSDFLENSAIGQCIREGQKRLKRPEPDTDMPRFSGNTDPEIVKKAMEEWRANRKK